MKLKKQLHMEAEWRRRTGHAYAENLNKLPLSKQARKHWLHKPYGIGENNEKLRTDAEGSCKESENADAEKTMDTGQVSC